MSELKEPTPKTIKIPGPDHPITIERNPARVVVTVAGRVIADTREALTLSEAQYSAVQYIPRKDVHMTLLSRTDRATYCPYTAPIRGAPATSAFRWAASARPTRCGPTKHPMLLLPTSRTIWPSIPTGSMRLRSARDRPLKKDRARQH
jgi:hypothetical protein